jgi:hypothetical protein
MRRLESRCRDPEASVTWPWGVGDVGVSRIRRSHSGEPRDEVTSRFQRPHVSYGAEARDDDGVQLRDVFRVASCFLGRGRDPIGGGEPLIRS